MKKILILIIVIFILGCNLFKSDEECEFNSVTWENKPDERYKMIDDFIENYLKLGMSRNSIEKLLGPPDFSLTNGYNLGDSSYNYTNELYIIYKNELFADFYMEKLHL